MLSKIDCSAQIAVKMTTILNVFYCISQYIGFQTVLEWVVFMSLMIHLMNSSLALAINWLKQWSLWKWYRLSRWYFSSQWMNYTRNVMEKWLLLSDQRVWSPLSLKSFPSTNKILVEIFYSSVQISVKMLLPKRMKQCLYLETVVEDM